MSGRQTSYNWPKLLDEMHLDTANEDYRAYPLLAWNVSQPSRRLDNTLQNDGAGPASKPPGKSAKPKCIACWTDLDLESQETVRMPCGHYWCTSSIIQAFTAVRNQTQWPVKCSPQCNVHFDKAKPFLPPEEIQRLLPLIKEFETPDVDRTYCSNARCSVFLPQGQTNKRELHCQACNTNTCSDCKGSAHQSYYCPLPDANEQQTLKLAYKKRWQRCMRCGQMCERSYGCSRMVCYCGHVFCYHCGKPIYECNGCPRLEYDYLMAIDDTRWQVRTKGDMRAFGRQKSFLRGYVAWTMRRGGPRTEGETPFQQAQRLGAARRGEAERTQEEGNQMERARQEQSVSLIHRLGRKLGRLYDRMLGL